jgi:hypothetical protein
MTELPPITKGKDADGKLAYFFWEDQSWEGFETLLAYLSKYWDGIIDQQTDDVYSRRAVVRTPKGSIVLRHDSHQGNFFQPDSESDCAIVEQIFTDLFGRLADGSNGI